MQNYKETHSKKNAAQIIGPLTWAHGTTHTHANEHQFVCLFVVRGDGDYTQIVYANLFPHVYALYVRMFVIHRRCCAYDGCVFVLGLRAKRHIIIIVSGSHTHRHTALALWV